MLALVGMAILKERKAQIVLHPFSSNVVFTISKDKLSAHIPTGKCSVAMPFCRMTFLTVKW